MKAIVLEDTVRVPPGVSSLASFRRWTRTDEFPQRGKFSFLDGELWIDMSPEALYTHNRLKGEIARVIGNLLKLRGGGAFFADGVLLSNASANLCTAPDGVFVSWDAFKSGRVSQVHGVEGYVELKGAPDITIEVVSRSSERKDKVVLRDLYWRAGVPEYWLLDVRDDKLSFDILRHHRAGYRKTSLERGWLLSRALDARFKLTRDADELGNPDFTLVVK
jgi:Uma2 family endonuclease